MTAQADGVAKQVAVRAAALTAARAFVHGVCHERPTTLELAAEVLLIRQAGLMAQAEGLLLVGARTIARAR